MPKAMAAKKYPVAWSTAQKSPDFRYCDKCQNEKPKKKMIEVAISIRWTVINLINQGNTKLAITATKSAESIARRDFHD
jgi:hypothetical protein